LVEIEFHKKIYVRYCGDLIQKSRITNTPNYYKKQAGINNGYQFAFQFLLYRGKVQQIKGKNYNHRDGHIESHTVGFFILL